MNKTVKDLRSQLGAYLTKPLAVSSGNMSTQQNISATSLSQGGLTGQFVIGDKGAIIITDKVLIGYQLNGF